MYLLDTVQTADKRQKAVVRLAFEQDAPPSRKVIVQRPVAYVAIGCENTDARLSDLALTRNKDLDVVVVFKLMHLVEDNFPRAHPVAAFGIVCPAFDDALVFAPLDQLLGMVIVPA